MSWKFGFSSNKPLNLYLTNPCEESFLISPCTKNEIQETTSNFDNNKVSRINSIPLKVLKLFKELIAKHLIYLLFSQTV